LHENYERLWIAIYDQRVIAAGKDPRVVEHEAVRQAGVTSPKEVHALCGRYPDAVWSSCGSRTPELTILAFLAHSDDVPFVIGFADVLDRYQLRCDYRTGVAYWDERLLHWGRRWLGWRT
jgi:hypothetical protein